MHLNGQFFPIRRVTVEDTAWLHKVGEKCYQDGTYDVETAEEWIKVLMNSPNHLLLRGDRAWIVAWVQSAPYRPSFKTGHFLIVASLGNAIKELRTMTAIVIEWSKEMGASRVYWAAINGTDFGPIAEPFGALPVSPSYMLELT
jgi:hypothetical protein